MRSKIDALFFTAHGFVFSVAYLATAPGTVANVLTGLAAGVLIASAVLTWIASYLK